MVFQHSGLEKHAGSTGASSAINLTLPLPPIPSHFPRRPGGQVMIAEQYTTVGAPVEAAAAAAQAAAHAAAEAAAAAATDLTLQSRCCVQS